MIKQNKRKDAPISSIIAGKGMIDVDAKTNRAWAIAGLIEAIPIVSGLITGFIITDTTYSSIVIIGGFVLSIIIVLILIKKIPPAPIEIINN